MDSRIKLLRHPFFVIGILCYTIVHFSRATSQFLPNILNNHLTDILCIPLVSIFLTCIIRVLKNDSNYWPSFEMIWSLGLLYVFLFEFILPRMSEVYTADVRDIVAYLTGIVLYYLLIDNKLFITRTRK